MTDEEGDCIYQTSEVATYGLRLFYWGSGIFVSITMATLIALEGGLAWGIFLFAGMWGVILLNGFRLVIGVGVYADRLCITTPLAYREFAWNQVTIRWYASSFFRTDVSVKGVVWPYMIAFGLPGWRSAVKAIKKAKEAQGESR